MIVDRPVRTVETLVDRAVTFEGMILDKAVYEDVEIGGVDACPVCAVAAESDYQSVRQERQSAQFRAIVPLVRVK